MKKYLSIAMLAVAAMAAFSCTNEMGDIRFDVIPGNHDSLVITAIADDDIAPDTKTSLDGVNVVWATTDAIAGYEGSTRHVSTETAIAEAGKKAAFTFSGVSVETNLDNLIYPATAAGAEDSGLYHITLPTEQTAVANSFADGANIALANGKVADEDVQFKNLGAVIGIQINNDDIESVKISANEAMTGAGIADPSDFSAIDDSGEKYVKLTGGLANGTPYYAVVYPSPVSGYTDLEIEVENVAGQTATYSNPNALVLSRNDNKRVANITVNDAKWTPTMEKWSYTFSSQQYSAVGTKTLDGKSWTLAGAGSEPGFGYSSTKGQQFGTAANPFSSFTLTSNFGSAGIRTVKVTASTANDATATIALSVGGEAFKCGGSTSPVALTNANADYEFVSPNGKVKTGDIVISVAQTTSKGLYIKTIDVNGKGSANIQWQKSSTETTTDTATMLTGDDTLPTATLYNPSGLTITYESSNMDVATINATTGVISLVAEGETIISATSEETSMYSETTRSYTLTVTDSRTNCATPSFSPAAGEVSANTEVTVSSNTAGATLYYTLDGSTPTISSSYSTLVDGSGKPYVVITIDVAKTIKAIAVKDDWKNSALASASYTVSGIATPLDTPQDVVITSMNATSFTATWSAADNASGYSWKLSTSSDPSEAAIIGGSGDIGSGSTESLSVSSGITLSAGTRYYFHIMSVGDDVSYSDSDYETAHLGYYSLTPDNASTGSDATAYITTLTEFTYNTISWKMNQWNPKTLQIKTNQSGAASEFRFYNTSAFSGRITKVVISFSALTVSDASKLMFKGGSSEVSVTSSGTAGTWNGTAKTLTWTPGDSDDFTYFAFYQNGKAASGTNYLAESNAIFVTYE